MSDTPQTDAVMIDPLRDGNDLPALARRLERERNDLLKQNAKLRDIAERAIWRAVNGVCLPDASAVRAIKAEGLRLRAELDQLKEGAE